MNKFIIAIVFGLVLGTAFAAVQGVSDSINKEISSKLP